MTLANDGIRVTPGSGQAVAVHDLLGTASGVSKYHIVIPARHTGHMADSQPTYNISIPHLRSNNTDGYHWEVFNQTGSGVTMIVRHIRPQIRSDLAVAPTASVRFDLFRTTTISSGGTASKFESTDTNTACISRLDPSDPAIATTSDITCKTMLTSITTGTWLWPIYVFPEETNVGSLLIQHFNLIPEFFWGKSLQVPEGQGIAVRQRTGNTSAGSVGWLIQVTTSKDA